MRVFRSTCQPLLASVVLQEAIAVPFDKPAVTLLRLASVAGTLELLETLSEGCFSATRTLVQDLIASLPLAD